MSYSLVANEQPEGILLVNKPRGMNSFGLVRILRKRFNIKKIGHSGTLDPFATGVMVMLIGRAYTRLADTFLGQEKEYVAEVFLGKATDTYDCDGQIVAESPLIPTQEQLESAIHYFQGVIEQTPPMFSAKKIQGKRLYDLARQGIEVERKAVQVQVKTTILSYHYPILKILVTCSKGTYIRSIAHDLGNMLGCGAHLTALERVRSGLFHLNECLDGQALQSPDVDLKNYLRQLPH